jgi:branched-chain amino acid aminotransferase
MLECDFKWRMAKPVIGTHTILLDPSARFFIMVKLFFEGMKAYKDESDDVWLLDLMRIIKDSIIQL